MNIEVRLYLPDGLSQHDVERLSKDLELMSKIAFMTAGKQSDRGIRNVYAIHKGGKFTGYRIEDFEYVPDKFDPNHLYTYSEGLSRREIKLEEMDKIAAKLKELRSNHT
jgi:hypothetical protein